MNGVVIHVLRIGEGVRIRGCGFRRGKSRCVHDNCAEKGGREKCGQSEKAG